jgi:hypothetical protein
VTEKNVVYPKLITKMDLPPDRIIEAAIGKMSEVVICGYNNEGKFYIASSVADGGSILWHLEHAKRTLLAIVDS